MSSLFSGSAGTTQTDMVPVPLELISQLERRTKLVNDKTIITSSNKCYEGNSGVPPTGNGRRVCAACVHAAEKAF